MNRSLLAAFFVLLCACGSKHGTTVDASGDDASDATTNPTVDANLTCSPFGAACAGGSTCCSGVCDPSLTCGTNVTTCTPSGAACTANTDCCTTSCINDVCAANQCTPDTQACTSNSQCCSGACGTNGTCTPLNTTCKTDGNPCTTGTQCCSQDCGANGLCGQGSYCIQNGDACAHDNDCCGGICTPGAGGLGTCTQPTVNQTNCSAGIDGTVCNGCGDCCSRLCAPYGQTGVKVCQPAEGCRIDGDLCRKDSDCCGAAGTGLPGAGNVTCVKANATDPVGICRNPQSCNPEGDVCHYQNYATCGNSSARNDCCGGLGNSGVCQLDQLGIPRCYGLGTACHQAGDTCAFSGDCCNGNPCIPDANGILHCSATTCSNPSGACSSSADCCNGETCTFAPGSVQGTCGGGGTGTCAEVGQDCSAASPCCAGISCNVTGSNPVMACPAGQTTGCSCFNVLF